MRVSYVFLVAAATLHVLLSSEVVSATPSALSKTTSADAVHSIKVAQIDGTSARSLKSKKTSKVVHEDDEERTNEERAAEERAAEARMIDSKILANILSDHTYAKQVFSSWLQNGQTKDEIENRLKTQGLLEKYSSVVTQYGQYLALLEGKPV